MATFSAQDSGRLDFIVQAIAERRCVLFLGAGANSGALGRDGRPLPISGLALAELIAERFSIDSQGKSLSLVCEYAEATAGRAALNRCLIDLLGDATPPPHMLQFPKYDWTGIYTTNYDTLVESAYRQAAGNRQHVWPVVSSRDNVSAVPAADVLLVKLHGCITRASEAGAELVLTRRDYLGIADNRRQLLSRLSGFRAGYTVLYLGHSLNDPDLLDVLEVLQKAVGRDYLPRSYCLMPGHSVQDQQVFDHWKIDLLDLDAEVLFRTLADRIGAAREKAASYQPRSPAGTDQSECERAVRSLDVRTQALIASNLEVLGPHVLREPSNEATFFNGDRPSWGIFVKDFDAPRSAYNEVMDELLDHVVGKARGPKCIVLTSDAGAGKTVLLRRLAFDLATDWTAPTLFCLDAAEIPFDAVEALATGLGSRLFLFVDRASHHAGEIDYVLRRARGAGVNLTLVCAERANEWHQATRNLPLTGRSEHYLDRLEDSEIEALLDVLERASMLGALAALDGNQRFDEIKTRADKQLLVALREAREGKRFDEIIADEYASLPTAESRECYAIVCAMHAVGAPTRLGLLHRLTGIPYERFYDVVFGPAEGVIVPADDRAGASDFYVTESYRSRHETIAKVVLETCIPTEEERLRLLRSAVQHLDAGLQEDRAAIRLLTLGIEELRGIDSHAGRSSLLQALTEADPRNSIVWQHWALLELHGGNHDRALELIEQALERRQAEPILLHTKAMILGDVARATNDAMRRERIYREAHLLFETCKRKDSRSTYAYHAQARMFLDRAEDAQNSAEKLRHLRQGYQIIRDGLAVCHNRAILYQQLGDLFNRFYRDYDRSRDAFEHALEADRKDVPSRYLYARMEYNAGHFEKAAGILDEALTIDQSDANCLYWRARCEEDLHFDQDDRICSLYERAAAESRNDMQILFRHACYLYRRGLCERAGEVFGRIDMSDIAYLDQGRRRLTFLSPADGSPVQFEGVVVNRGAKHCFVRRDTYGDHVYGSLLDVRPDVKQNVRSGARVKFTIAFNLKGPIAHVTQVLR